MNIMRIDEEKTCRQRKSVIRMWIISMLAMLLCVFVHIVDMNHSMTLRYTISIIFLNFLESRIGKSSIEKYFSSFNAHNFSLFLSPFFFFVLLDLSILSVRTHSQAIFHEM